MKPGSAEWNWVAEAIAPLQPALPDSARLQKMDFLHGEWRIWCGSPFFRWDDPEKKAFLLPGGQALCFELYGVEDRHLHFNIHIFWKSGWSLMLQDDPIREALPLHPRLHYQFEKGSAEAPFLSWRLPAGNPGFREGLSWFIARLENP